MIRYLARIGIRSPWDVGLLLAFIPGAASWALIVLLQPAGLGTHASIYTDAAAAWLRGADPWQVGPPTAVFAGPPTMLLPFVPFVALPWDLVRVIWFALDVLVAMWVLRRLALAAYWLAFPPLFSAIILGHLEVLILAALVLGGAVSGLAAVVKPYAVFPLVASRRWKALAVAVGVVGLTAPILPWGRFIEETQLISATIARQHVGDPIFPAGGPVLVVAAVVVLAALGPTRALWLCGPVLWPYAQPIYKTMTLPVLTPVLAIFWALPVPGSTLAGLVAFATLVTIDRRWRLPARLREGILPVASPGIIDPPAARTVILREPAAT